MGINITCRKYMTILLLNILDQSILNTLFSSNLLLGMTFLVLDFTKYLEEINIEMFPHSLITTTNLQTWELIAI